MKVLSLPLLLFALLPLNSSAFVGTARLHLTRLDAARRCTGTAAATELIQRAVARGRRRLSTLLASAPLQAGESEYTVDLSIGTPPQPFSASVDTGSDLVWTQCEPCVLCYDQRTPIFDPSKSSTFAKIPCAGELCEALERRSCNASSCHYTYNYADLSYTEGELAAESLAIGSTTVASIAFGCGSSNNGVGFSEAAGFVGLGRGKLSLISQLGILTFSFCFTSFGSPKKGSLLLGSLPPSANPNSSSPPSTVSTPILLNSFRPSFYYISLKGITVGTTRLDIPSSAFAIRNDGSGGMIIDSGTSITFLEYAAYAKVEEAFSSQIKNLSSTDESVFDLDLCYELPTADAAPETLGLPRLVLHLEGGDVELSPASLFGVDGETRSMCLMMAASNGLSVFGNFQQQSTVVMYDLGNEKLSIIQGSQC
ncbi:hypothetical protein Cni_G28844 [Canna indica]|uniref:nepenthesin n=1 Tax=Canna indica TaxID=4628 RepID=A0AAQ3LAH5_9LILI|nr:hypothetical protein Cni_G28844 [Canna indica]